MNRRQDVIDAAVTLLREEGPDVLTTVAVAARLGITQSAIYRHVHSVDELASVASRQVVAEDVIRVARLVRDGRFPGGRSAISRILELRLLAGYAAYATDMNTRLDLEIVVD